MWHDSAFARQLGIRYPIVQGPFGGGPSTPELVAAVSNAGGLGSYGAHNLSPEQIRKTAEAIRALTRRPFAINLWVGAPTYEVGRDLVPAVASDYIQRIKPFFDELGITEPPSAHSEEHDFSEQVEALIGCQPAAFSFVFGIPPEPILKRCRARGITTIGAATTVQEAVALERAGVDMVVATGLEAGGHRPAFMARPNSDTLMGSFALIPQIRDAVSIPVIAAGGIADSRGTLAAMMLGADAVQIGTAFLACDESGAKPFHKQALRSGNAYNTTLTRVYSGRLARYLTNRLTAASGRWPTSALPFPFQSGLTRPLKTAAAAQSNPAIAPMAAGQSGPLVRHSHASELIQSIVSGVERLINSKLEPTS